METVKIDKDGKYSLSELIDEIVDAEWEMFRNVSNIGGPAQCQSDNQTFRIMRKAQFSTWSQETLLSYLGDLARATHEGRNVMSEKYGRMMAVTHPDEYEQIASMLPPLSQESVDLVEHIAAYHEAWDREAAERFPYVRAQGRPREAESTQATSADTYLRGELLTYSPSTLDAMLRDVEKAAAEKKNLVIAQLEVTVRAYGYRSLDQYEHQLAQREE